MDHTPISLRLTSAAGLVLMIGIAWAISYDRKRFPWRIVLWGTGLQLLFGLFVLKSSVGLWLFSGLNSGFNRLLSFTTEGSRFLFGPIVDREFSVALNVLPTIVFFSTLMTVLYYLGVMQKIVHGVAWVMQRTLKTSGAETLSAAANIFVGQTEAPLIVRPFIATMTQSEIMAVMVPGFASVAGGVLAAYVGMLSKSFPNIAGHLIAASVLSAPAGLLIAKVILPETETPATQGTVKLPEEQPYANVIDAAATGARDGMFLALNVAAMLLAFLALVALVNYLIALPAIIHNEQLWLSTINSLRQSGGQVPSECISPADANAVSACIAKYNTEHLGPWIAGWTPWSMERALAIVGWPVTFALGVPLEDVNAVSALLGERIVLNEFVGYVHLSENLASANPISPRAATIASYALCGFANFGSIAIQIGGIGSLAPERKGDLARLGFRAMIGGVLSSYMVACVAGILV